MPTRLKIGDNEAEWINEIQEAAAAVAASAVANDQNELNANLGRLTDLSPSVASSIAALILIARTYSVIEFVAEGRDDVSLSTVADDNAVYMILEASNGNRALVQPMANSAMAAMRAIEILKEIIAHGNSVAVNCILLVLDDEPSGRLRAAIGDNSNITAVVVGRPYFSSFGLINRGIEKLLDLEAD